MEFLNPAALYAFSLLPILLVPYLIRRRPRRFVFSSLLFLREFPARSTGRPWGRLRLPLNFFLQLLFMLLLVLALGEPVFTIRPPQKLAIVFDNSASMQALEGRKSRFEIAREKARELIQNLSAGARVDLFLTVPRPGRIGGASLTPGEALALIAKIDPYDLGDSHINYGEALSRLAKDNSYNRFFFLTDHPVRGQGGSIEVISVGRPQENLAITSFDLTRAPFISSRLRARIEVTNFSSKERKVKLLLKGGGRILSTQTHTVAARRTVVAVFKGFPFHPYYGAELESSDALALDNRRFAVPPPLKGLSILGISPRPQALESLRSIPGLTLKVIPPDAYEKTTGEGQRLEIFHFSTPAVLPQSHALFVLPPKKNPMVSVGRPLFRPVISSWRDPHPLTRYVNFALFRPPYARPLRPLSFGEEIIQGPEGPLALAVEREGFRYLFLGFDPFPYLGRDNLPVSIFTLNLLGWFHEALVSSSTTTGKPLKIGGRPKDGVLLTPKGDKLAIKEESTLFYRTFFQGIYQVVRDGGREAKAVNFYDLRESDLANPFPVDLKREGKVQSDSSFFLFLWPYFLLLSLLLLFLEWLFNPPTTQPRSLADRGGLQLQP
ncbi:MAG: BatA domain-containing protein [Candidatus Binatia bacterium]